MRNNYLLRAAYLVSFLFLLACGSQKISKYDSKGVVVDSTAGQGGLETMIAPYREDMEAEMDEVIGIATETLEKNAVESPLSNFAADAVYEAGLKYGRKSKDIGPDAMEYSFALLNFGGLRAPINKGEITVGDVYELMPFDNTLVLVKLSGGDVRRLVNYLEENNGQPVSNATFQYEDDTSNLAIGDLSYQYDKEVVVITSNYLAQGGDKMDFLTTPIRKWDSGILLRDIFIDYIREKETLGAYPLEGRIQFSKN